MPRVLHQMLKGWGETGASLKGKVHPVGKIQGVLGVVRAVQDVAVP